MTERGENVLYKILVVDDEANIRKLIAKYASFEGYQVEEASNGEQAVGLCRSGSFDLIVLDIMMPGMDGLTACAKIKEFSDVPIIMLSARGEEYDKIYGFRMGIDDYVVKPFSPKELMLRIQAVLKRCAPPEAAKKKEEKKTCILWILAIIGIVAAVAAVAYAVYRYLTPDYLEDFDDDFDDDFEDEDLDKEEPEKEASEEKKED